MSETTRSEITKNSEMTKNEFRLFTLKDWQEIERIHRQKDEANANKAQQAQQKSEIISADINITNATSDDNADNTVPTAEELQTPPHTI